MLNAALRRGYPFPKFLYAICLAAVAPGLTAQETPSFTLSHAGVAFGYPFPADPAEGVFSIDRNHDWGGIYALPESIVTVEGLDYLSSRDMVTNDYMAEDSYIAVLFERGPFPLSPGVTVDAIGNVLISLRAATLQQHVDALGTEESDIFTEQFAVFEDWVTVEAVGVETGEEVRVRFTGNIRLWPSVDTYGDDPVATFTRADITSGAWLTTYPEGGMESFVIASAILDHAVENGPLVTTNAINGTMDPIPDSDGTFDWNGTVTLVAGTPTRLTLNRFVAADFKFNAATVAQDLAALSEAPDTPYVEVADRTLFDLEGIVQVRDSSFTVIPLQNVTITSASGYDYKLGKSWPWHRDLPKYLNLPEVYDDPFHGPLSTQHHPWLYIRDTETWLYDTGIVLNESYFPTLVYHTEDGFIAHYPETTDPLTSELAKWQFHFATRTWQRVE